MSAYPPYPPAPAPPRRIRWWLVAVSAAWAVLLVVLAVWAMRTDAPTVREQRTLRAAYGPLERAARALVQAADPAGVIAFGPPEVRRGCRLTAVRAGGSAVHEVVLRVRPGTGPAALDAVAGRLPAAWNAGVRHRPDRDEHRLDADAGDFIEVRGAVEDGGAVVRLRADTGCRPDDDPLDWPTWAPVPGARAPQPEAGALGVTVVRTSRYSINCGGDASAQAFVAEARPAPADLAARLAPVVDAGTIVQAGPGLVAYKSPNGLSTVVTAVDGTVRIAQATGCAG